MPRVLVLSGEIPQTRNAGGILLWRLLRGYGLQPEAAEGRSLEIGDRARASSSEFPSSASPKTKHTKIFVIGPKPHGEAELLDCPYRELRMPLARLEHTRLSMHKRSLAALGFVPLPSHEHVMNLLGDFKPEVVVCVMANTPWILTAERTARNLGVPLVLIVHDINEEFEKVFPWAKDALFRRNRDVYRSAARRLCVSPEMAVFLEKRYGVPGEVMYPNRSEELQPRAAELSLELRSAADNETTGPWDKERERHEARGERREGHASATLTLGYAGSVAYGYGEALVDLIPVLREVGARILISTPRPPEKLKALLEANDVVEWMPHRADINEMWRTMQERADVMILPYSNPARGNELLYRTHFPSKLTEYLALGMPVIVSGPGFATGLRYAQPEKLENGKAEPEASRPEIAPRQKLKFQAFQSLPQGRLAEPRLSISDFLNFAPNGAVPCTTREELVACLSRLKHDGELRMELVKRAAEAGRRDFDPVEIKKRFQQILKELCS